MIGTSPVPLMQLISDARLHAADVFGNIDAMVTGISANAQRTERNQLFVATVGTRIDSHLLLAEAVGRGASALVVERDIPRYPGVTMVRVPCTRAALGPLAHAFHGNPWKAMTVVGVTGTNGKTTVTSLINAVMSHAGRRTALIGTLGTFWNGKYCDEHITTPDALTLARTFAQLERDGVDFVAMEVSSHGIHQARVAGIPFHAGVITNVTQDHLDYHGDMASYVAVKRSMFFDYVAPTAGSVSCFNVDDPVGEELTFSYPEGKTTFSTAPGSNADVRATNVSLGMEGTRFTLHAGDREAVVHSRLVGAFNLSNLLAAASACLALGVDIRVVGEGLSRVSPISGRFERIACGQPFNVIVDYAHTPDGLEKVLRTARQLTAGSLITVFGCGGDRDKTKRAPMGRTVGRLSDEAIVTSDNPRFEDPELIARMAVEGLLLSGLKPAHQQVILDRALAIEKALHRAKPGDTVVIAGKGHETYQEIQGRRYDFDDRVVVREVLAAMEPAWRPLASAPIATPTAARIA
jgi:UDP-N-acetylmuramoyl-L-alanyl-D-glutamate--2,6-diaminopimelate ligase